MNNLGLTIVEFLDCALYQGYYAREFILTGALVWNLMEITDTDRQSLARFGEEAVALLKSGDFNSLASRFGYAVSFDRDPAKAIEQDVAACRTSEARSQRILEPSVSVKYFEPNDTRLFAAVECVTHLPDGMPISVGLIVFYNGTQRHIYLESIDAL